jgi:hypothetical protein
MGNKIFSRPFWIGGDSVHDQDFFKEIQRPQKIPCIPRIKKIIKYYLTFFKSRFEMVETTLKPNGYP